MINSRQLNSSRTSMAYLCLTSDSSAHAKLLEEKKKTYAEYRRSREEMRELLTAKANVDRVLKMEVEQDVEKEKDHGQR